MFLADELRQAGPIERIMMVIVYGIAICAPIGIVYLFIDAVQVAETGTITARIVDVITTETTYKLVTRFDHPVSDHLVVQWSLSLEEYYAQDYLTGACVQMNYTLYNSGSLVVRDLALCDNPTQTIPIPNAMKR